MALEKIDPCVRKWKIENQNLSSGTKFSIVTIIMIIIIIIIVIIIIIIIIIYYYYYFVLSDYTNSFNLSNVAEVSANWIRWDGAQVQVEKKADILRCCFAEHGKEMYVEGYFCSYKPIVVWSSRCRRRLVCLNYLLSTLPHQ